MNAAGYDYGEIREPPARELEDPLAGSGDLYGQPLLYSHVFIIAWDSAGKRYVFGTTPKMLKGKVDAEQFRTCDLRRYPVGPPTGFVNKVVVIQTYSNPSEDNIKKVVVYRTTADGTLRKYDSREYFKVLREL